MTNLATFANAFSHVSGNTSLGYDGISLNGGIMPSVKWTLPSPIAEGDEITISGNVQNKNGIMFFGFNLPDAPYSQPQGGIQPDANGDFSFTFTALHDASDVWIKGYTNATGRFTALSIDKAD